jgi:SAM-dependent methyltransferase
MQFGFKDKFEYIKCSNCESLALTRIPSDLSRYYPGNYYSFLKTDDSKIKIFIKKMRARSILNNKFPINKIFIYLFGLPPFIQWIQNLNIRQADPILDVGCGSGFILKDMYYAGFTNLTGIDPYINKNQSQSENIKFLKTTIYDIKDKFKLIMYNHSLEHTYKPLMELNRAKNLLLEDGIILIRIPVVNSYIWDKYNTNWVQIDAPRHIFVPSRKGMEILCDRAGLKIFKISYDSNEFQFWGSEQYQNGIPLEDNSSYLRNPSKSIFDKKTIKEYHKLSLSLNEQQKGDQACFYLKKSN